MSRLIVIGALLAASMSTPALAWDGEQSKAGKVEKEKRICRRAVPTGSVMPKITCRTRAEWAVITQRSQEDLQRQRDMERSRSAVGIAKGL